MDDNKASLHLSLPPHLRLPAGAGSVTGDLLIALAPALILAVIHYGVRAAVLILTCMLVSAALTAIWRKLPSGTRESRKSRIPASGTRIRSISR